MASPVDTSVKFYHYLQTGAPTLNGVAGSMLAVFDACLKDGFGLKTADSLVVAGGVATFNVSTGHSAEVGQVQLVAGATPAGLNGEQKVTAVTPTSWSFATALGNQTATGTISAKVAPAGWTKEFTGSNIAAYRGIAGLPTRAYLRVDDTATKFARVKAYATMSDINTGTDQFPQEATQAGGLYWGKSDTASATAMNWILVCDGGFLYFIVSGYQASYPGGTDTSNNRSTFCFGDMPSYRTGDAYSCFISGSLGDTSVAWNGINNANDVWYHAPASTTGGKFFQRSYNQTSIGARASTGIAAPWTVPEGYYFGSNGMPPATQFPNPVDGSLVMSQVHALEPAQLAPRGYLPGIYGCGSRVPANLFDDKQAIPGNGGLAGKSLKFVRSNYNPFSTTGACVFFDSTGPWR